MEKITPSFWKHLWSYISPVHLETTHSAYNPVLQVYWSKGEYQLLTENAIYSFGRYYSNFGKVFQEIDFKAFKAENILILGFGLGSIPMILEKKLPYKHYYTAVEIDPEVLRLANKYAMPHLPKDFCIDFICNDAELFIEVCQDEYDLICMDIFLDATVPTAFEELVFLENLKNLLSVCIFAS